MCRVLNISRLKTVVKTKPPDIEKRIKSSCALEIIDYFKPKFWFIENPDGGKLKEQEFMKDHRTTV